MKRAVSYVFVVLLGLLVAACSTSDSDVADLDAQRADRAPAKYLVVADGELSPRFSDYVASNGDVLESLNADAGVAVVTTARPGVYKRFASTVVPDMDFAVVDSAYEPMAVTPEEIAQPPFTGDDDFFFDLQWGHTAVRAQEAWAAGSRGAGATVFVLDEGFDLTHPDLAPNYDLTRSATFVPGTTDAQYLLNDPFSHGTHVAGTIAAADNAFGTIGVAPEATIVPVKVLSEVQGSGAFSWVIEGILHAAENGADVINMSLGAIVPQNGFYVDDDGNLAKDASNEIAALRVAVNKAIQYANSMGATVIVSAGNDGLDLNTPEAASLINFQGFASHAVSISAVGPEGWGVDPTTDLTQQAYYTNVGPEVDFASAGGTVDFDLYFADPQPACTVAGLTRPCYVFDFVFSTGSLGSWYWSIGTSMAAPHAAGIAALIIGEHGGDMKPAEVKAEMRDRAIDLGKPGGDDLFGYGLTSSGY